MLETKPSTWLLYDQRRRWRQGDPVRVETYLQQYPGLANHAEVLLDLVYSEIDLREQQGEHPRLDEYLQRFPQLQSQLRVQLEVHQLLRAEPRTRITPIPRPPSVPPADSRLPLPTPGAIPGYEILGELGRGGMGVVYRARQTALKRLVALKMILGGRHASLQEVARFRIEAEAAARLQHSNIVQIHEVAEHEGTPYLCLELVEGVGLDCRLAGQPQPSEQAAHLVETLARAMHYAHQQGIIHRDLKPGNILLAAGTVPKITDFGLAKLLDSDETQMTAGGIVGTPCYMAPEQAAGRGARVGPATDVYALGAILYELLTGRPPFEAATTAEVVYRVMHTEPLSPRRWRPRLSRDLETICLKCLRKEPSRRYASAEALAEDLRRFRTGEPIQARATPAWERAWKWVRRRPAVAVLLGGSVLAGAVAGGLTAQWQQADRQAHAKQTELLQYEQDRAAYPRFVQLHDDALFSASYGSLFVDRDAPRNHQETRAAARAALALVQLTIDSDSTPVFPAGWTPAEQAAARRGCGQLLLILADQEAKPAADAPLEERRQRARQALALLERSARLTTPGRGYHQRRAGYLHQLGETAEEGQELRRAWTLRPVEFLDCRLPDPARSRSEDFERARRELEQVLLRQPRDFWARFFLAHCDLHLGRAREAEEGLSECSKQRPGCCWAYLLRSSARQKQGQFAAAEDDLRHGLELQPNDEARYALLVQRGQLRLERQDYPAAESDLRQALAVLPNQYAAYVLFAQLLHRQQCDLEASSWLEQAVHRRPPSRVVYEYHVGHAADLFRRRRFEAAVAACDAASRILPDDTEADGWRGLALVELKRFAPAIASLDRYLKCPEAHAWPDLFRGRGQARMQLGDYRGAVADYTRVLQVQPGSDIYTHRGWAYFFTDAWKLARDDFEDALQLDSAHGPAYTGRALAHVMLGQYRLAVADAEEALCLQPDSPEMLHNLACVFAQAAVRVQADAAEGERRIALAAAYRGQAVEVVRQTLTMLRPNQRGPFWREKILPDPALAPIRHEPGFEQLAREVASMRSRR